MFCKIHCLVDDIAWSDIGVRNDRNVQIENRVQNFTLKWSVFDETKTISLLSVKFPTKLSQSLVFTKDFNETNTFSELLNKFESDELVNIQLLATQANRNSVVIASYRDSLLNFLYPLFSLNIAYDDLPREITLTAGNSSQEQRSAKLNLMLSVEVLNRSEQKERLQNQRIRSSPDLNFDKHRPASISDNSPLNRPTAENVFPLGAFRRRISSFRSYMLPTFSSAMMAESKIGNFPNDATSQTSFYSSSLPFKRPFVVKKVPQDLFERLPVDHIEMPPYNFHTGGSGPRHMLPSCDKYWLGRDKSVPDFFKYASE